MADLAEPRPGIFRLGLLAYLGAGVSLAVCFWTSVFGLVAPILGLTFIDINPHVQAVIMWLFAAIAVVALFFDRKQHGENAPFVIGAAALIVIVGTLYTFYDRAILVSGCVLLLIAAFLNQNWMLAFLNHKVQRQAAELAEMNDTLESRVGHQSQSASRASRPLRRSKWRAAAVRLPIPTERSRAIGSK
jgi:MerC mercury resistance protein